MRYSQLGGITATEVIRAMTSVATDPCLKPVATALVRIDKARYGPTSTTVSTGGHGIGLCKIKAPLEAWAWMEERATWFPYVVGAGIVAGLFTLGYVSGKKKRKR